MRDGTAQPTVCVLCSHNCGLRVDVANNRITEVRADPDNPITRGYVCNKAFSIPHYVEHAQRVTHPLVRTPGGGFARTSWDEAIANVGSRLAAIRDQHGPKSIALVGVGGQANHMDGFYALGFLSGLGSPWWFNSLAQEKTQHALVDRWMFGTPPTAFLAPDAEHSEYLLVMGTNPLVSNRGHNATELFKTLRGEGRTVVVVDPRRTQTARQASEHVAVRPGRDVYFLLGLIATIVRDGLHDRDFVGARTRGWAALEAAVANLDVADLAARAGVAADQIERVARGFATARTASVLFDLGVEQTPFSTLNSYLLRLLHVLTGNLGNRGGLVFQGLFSPPLPGLGGRPFRAPVSGIEAISMLAPIGMFSPSLLAEEILADRPDRIRAVIVEGANPMIMAAGTAQLRRALERLDLLVVIEPAMSETARLAHVVLPTPVGYEKWEYSAFPKGYPEIYAQLRPPVVTGPPDAIPEPEIYARLARATGIVGRAPRLLHALAAKAQTRAGALAYLAAVGALAYAAGRSPRAALARLVFWLHETLGPRLQDPALASMWLQTHLYALLRHDDVARANPGISRLALGEHLFRQLLAHPEGVEVGRLDPDRNFETHCRSPIELAPPPMIGEIRRAMTETLAADRDLPFVLDTGRRTPWNANAIHRDPAWRKGKGPHCAVVLHPDDATPLGIASGSMCEVTTRTGSVRLPAQLDDNVLLGTASIPNGFGTAYPDLATGELVVTGVAVNELTDAADRDPFTGCPHHKHVRCRIALVG